MIEKIIAFSLKNKLIIGILTLLLIAWGAYNFTILSIDAVPDITNNQVQIVTTSPSLSPQEVEQFITFPVEIAMANLQDVTEIRSISRFGLSVVTIVFKDRVDPYLARQLVSEQIQIAANEIPAGYGKPEMMPITTGLGEIYQYVIIPKPGYKGKYGPVELRTIQDWIIKRQLSGIPGIVEISSFGGFLKQYEVSVKPRTLVGMDLTILEIFDALEKNNQNSGGSYIEKGPDAYYIRAEGLIKNEEDIGNIVIKSINNVPVLIKDVAEVNTGWATRFGAMTRNGEGEAVGGITLMLKGANSASTISSVKERIEKVQVLLPEGLEIHAYLDRSELINKTISTVTRNLVEGGLIVILVLILLVGNYRASLIVASVIPLSMLFAFSMMNLFNVSANLMSLGAIDFGLIVDGSVIVTEGILFRLERRRQKGKLKQGEMDNTVLRASGNVGRSAVFGVTIILIVYIPILAFTGIEGKMFKPMAQTVSFALVGALLLSLTYVPVMASLFLNRRTGHGTKISDRIINFLNRSHRPVLQLALKYKWTMLAITVLIIVMSFFQFGRMGGEFIPTLEEGDLAAQMTLSPGSSLSESIESSTKAERILLDEFPEVVEVVSKIGTAEVPTDPMAVEDADIMIILKDKDDWVSADTREGLVEKMKEALDVLPGLAFEFQQPIQLRFNELMTGVKADVAVKIYGEDIDELYNKAYESASLIKDVQGAGDVRVEQITGLPQLVVRYRRDMLALYGLTIQEVNKVIRASFAGEKAGVVFEGERRFDLVVRLKEDFRQNIRSLENLRINKPSEDLVLLKHVADISFEKGPMQISRDDTRRRVTIGINVRNRDVESFVNEVHEVLDENIELLPGYFITYGGQFENLQDARRSSSIAVPIALAAIFVLLYFAFYSLKQAVMIFTAIPLSAVGGIWALYLRDMPFSISAGVGFIALFGVAVLNGIVLISYYNQLEKEGIENLYERVIKGTKMRLRPVVMTASVAALGFIPMALSTAPGAEVQRPLATVVIGGLITATFLTLVILPVIYVLFEKVSSGKSAKNAAVILLILVSFPAFSQQNTAPPMELNLEEAIDIAVENNPVVTNADLKILEARMNKKASVNIPNPSLEYTRGQINSQLIDYHLNIVQEIQFPTVYTTRAKYNEEIVRLTELEAADARLLLAGSVKEIYYRWMILDLLREIWLGQDSLFKEFQKTTTMMYDAGDINYLNKVMADTRSSRTEIELARITAEMEAARIELRQLMNIDGDFRITPEEELILQLPPVPDSSFIEKTPVLRSYQQQVEVANALIRSYRHRMLPDLKAAWFTQSLDKSTGFEGWQVGINIPLWFWSYRGDIKSATLQREQAQNEYEYQLRNIFLEIERLKNLVERHLGLLNYYEDQVVLQSRIMIEQTDISYRSGEIDYLEYLQNMTEAYELQMEYLRVINDYNQSVIHLEYFLGRSYNIEYQ